jgi:hypothetical protein
MARMIELTTPPGKDLLFRSLRGREELGRYSHSRRYLSEVMPDAGLCVEIIESAVFEARGRFYLSKAWW